MDRLAGAGADELLFAAHGQLDRAPGGPGEHHRDEVVGVDVDLAAEAASHRGLSHGDAPPVQAEAVGQFLAVHEHHVDRADDLQVAVGVEVGDDHMRLDGCRGGLGARVGAAHDHRRAPLGLGQVAGLEVPLHRTTLPSMSSSSWIRGRAGLQCLEGVVHGGKLLVVDVDQVEGAMRGRRVDGCDRGHLVTDAADHPVLERDVVVPEPEAALVHVACVNHCIYAWHGFGRGGVDVQDPGVGMGAALDRAGQQAAQLQVVGVSGASGDLVGGVELGNSLAYDRVVGSRFSARLGLLQRGAHALLLVGAGRPLRIDWRVCFNMW